jgi:cytochrome c oxidase accessory protein FixG
MVRHLNNQGMDEHRDHLSTVAEDGHRIWVYPEAVQGLWAQRRTWVAWTLLAVLIAGPWLRIHGEPLLRLDVVHREFVIFGHIFLAHDTFLFAWTMVTGFVAIIVLTVVFGRVFCGWICPQTIFLEFVFRPIERWIEGKPSAQRTRDLGPWTWDKIWRKGLKWGVFFGISFAIANTFLAYIIGSESLLAIQLDSPREHLGGLTSLLVFTAVFFFVFAWMREQVCTAVCPYGRLQGVLVDDDTINVTYDNVRGEPRGHLKKDKDLEAQGDCVDCGLCVRVCPTGVDIRNGLQLECIHCTACMDACDGIMDKVGKERGLIRYASIRNVVDRTPFALTRRAWAYLAVMLVMITGLSGFLATRQPLEINVFRAAGFLPKVEDSGRVVNMYNFALVNKTGQDLVVALDVKDTTYDLVPIGGDSILVPAKGRKEGVFLMYARNAEGPAREGVDVLIKHGSVVLGRGQSSFTRPL